MILGLRLLNGKHNLYSIINNIYPNRIFFFRLKMYLKNDTLSALY